METLLRGVEQAKESVQENKERQAGPRPVQEKALKHCVLGILSLLCIN